MMNIYVLTNACHEVSKQLTLTVRQSPQAAVFIYDNIMRS